MNTENFQNHPDQYVHWKLAVDGPVARLTLDIQEQRGFRQGYSLKLNSYDLGVDLELADAIQRLRFEHPQVRVLVLSSGQDRMFSAGANIYMLQSSSHAFKVNFCKFTNETRLGLEEFSREAGVTTLAALNGAASGGGYELAIACDEIHLIDDGNSAVSLPEVPLLGVLPGTGGLTRLVDKRKVRRDLADLFSTLAEGVRGPKALRWNLVDYVHPRSKFDQKIEQRLLELLGQPARVERQTPGIKLGPIEFERTDNRLEYSSVTLEVDDHARVATLTVRAPTVAQPTTPEALLAEGDQAWVLRAWRELDDALLQLRLVNNEVGLIVLRTAGRLQDVLDADRLLSEHAQHWLVREVCLHMARVLRRLDNTSKSLFAVIDEGSCFGGSLFEIALAADRSFMLNDPELPVLVQVGPLSAGALPMSQGLTRLQCRFLGTPEQTALTLERTKPLDADSADELGLVTFTPDDIDWEDEIRIAIEERASLSPDALTGMEQNLRFAGPETLDTKIFGRLSAWQNWIFTRPNATGQQGALTLYGKPERAAFDWKRT